MASFVYYTTSVLFPAHMAMLEEAILEDAKVDDNSISSHLSGCIRNQDAEKTDVRNTETPV